MQMKIIGLVIGLLLLFATSCAPVPSTPEPAAPLTPAVTSPSPDVEPVSPDVQASEPAPEQPPVSSSEPEQTSVSRPAPTKNQDTATKRTQRRPLKSVSDKMVTAPPSASAPVVPDIVPVLVSRSVEGAKVWLFAIDDGSAQLALSAEADGKLLMGRVDVTDPDSSVSWQTVASPDDTSGVSIADHWHIFAHGYHWLVFSVAGDSASYLLKLDSNFQRLVLVPVGHTDGPTNDMFLVAEPTGVAVAHFVPGYGHTIHRFDTQAEKTGQVKIGDGKFTHSNGSSAIPVEGGYLVFASEHLNPSATSSVKLIRFDESWQPVNVSVVLDEDGVNAAMATAVRLDSGYSIVHLRALIGVSIRQEAPSAPQPGTPGTPLPDDDGALQRLVLAPDGTIVSRETLVSDNINRPHTALVGDLLITTWDEAGVLHLRVDRIQ